MGGAFAPAPVVCLTLDKWETVSGQFGGYLIWPVATLSATPQYVRDQEQTGSVGSELEATL